MNLNLKYPPVPENAPRFASDIVEAAAELDHVTLTFTPLSLSDVDTIIENMRSGGLTLSQIAETIFGFGCYVGEVLVRNARGRWRLRSETQLAGFGGMPIVVELGSGTVCDPVGKAFKRFQNGKPDSLMYFYKVLTAPPERK